jgi:hypothetical protein
MYLVFQVGCIECGVSSYPIGITETLEEARKVLENHPSTWKSEGGDGCIYIVDLATCKNVEVIRSNREEYEPDFNNGYGDSDSPKSLPVKLGEYVEGKIAVVNGTIIKLTGGQ